MTTSTSAGVNTKKLLLGCRARFGTVRGKGDSSPNPLSPPMPAGPNPLRYPVGGSSASDRETAARSQSFSKDCRVHGSPTWGFTPPDRRRKVLSVGAARLPQIGGLSYGFYQSQTP